MTTATNNTASTFFALIFQNGELEHITECNDLRTLYHAALLDVRTFGTRARLYSRATKRCLLTLGDVTHEVSGNTLCEMVYYWMNR